MNLAEAHALLGVNGQTPLKDVRRAYTSRAQMLHPDKYPDNSDLRAEAERAMSQLNLAWETMQAATQHQYEPPSQHAHGTPDTSPRGSSAIYRPPVAGECDLCGCRPARQVKLRSITGMVLFWRRHLFMAELCRSCSVGAFREMQAASLVRGWWGILAPLANVVIVLSNLAEARRTNTMPAPDSRDPLVVAAFPGPVPPGRPVLSRPGPWFATIAAAIVAVAIIGGAASPQGSSSDTVIGICLNRDGYEVGCSSNNATWRIVDRGPTCASNQIPFTDESDRVYCAELK